MQYEDPAKPGNPVVVSPGAIVHVEEGSTLRWSALSVVKGQFDFKLRVCHSLKSF